LTQATPGSSLPVVTHHRIRAESVSAGAPIPPRSLGPPWLFCSIIAIAIFLGGEVAPNRSFGSSREGTAEISVYGVRSIDPSRLPGDLARLGVPGHRMGLSISRRLDSAALKVTKVATSPIAVPYIFCCGPQLTGGVMR
jgi:hypothetical protein